MKHARDFNSPIGPARSKHRAAPLFHLAVIASSLRAASVAGLLLLLAGCSGPVFSAARLPAEFRVHPTDRTGAIDLSRLASPSQSSSVIGPGDVLSIMMATGYEQNGPNGFLTRVDENGVADIHLVGEVAVAGLEPAEAERVITQASIERGVFRRANITVMIKRKYTNRVTVVGAVETQGVVELDRASSDLLGALAMAGGLTKDAGTEVQILRQRAPLASAAKSNASVQLAGHTQTAAVGAPGQPVPPALASERIDLTEASRTGLGNFRLYDGDVVMVLEDEPRVVHVMGLVRDPKEIKIPHDQDLDVLGALSEAGGRTMQIADKVHVIRSVPGQPEPIRIEVNVRAAKKNGAANLLLAPGDIVTVEETPATFVLGALQNLVRFGISGTTPLF